MPIDPTVIAVLLSAVEKDPENTALRLHLVSLMVDSERMDEALKHCLVILTSQPDQAEALSYAARAAEALGDSKRAEGYRRLLQALSAIDPASPPTSPRNPGERSDETDWPADLALKDPEPELNRLSVGNTPLPERGDVELFWGDQGDGDFWEAEKPGVTLAEVAGMEEVKRRLNLAFLAPLKNPDMMKMFGKTLRGGLLLYGPPGCGKTYIARATAGELGAKFIAIGLSDVLEMWVGQSERNLREIFQAARRNAPCVLFFDEIDALGQKRSLQRHSGARNIVNQLLSEMDSVNADNEGLFVLAATNHPWDVDTALRRPGRLDRTLLVLPPDAAARQAILQMQSRQRPIDRLDFKWLAEKCAEFSGADLVHLCESAAELAIEDSLVSGRARPIGMNDFKKVLKEIKPSTRAWFEVARNYAMFANDGGTYDELLDYLRAHRLI
ncbi:MAG TPA: AAA family ATPase [Blastocatellia bacterium]|nr:AAA family ATPase [Blastocatellia bacterium]